MSELAAISGISTRQVSNIISGNSCQDELVAWESDFGPMPNFEQVDRSNKAHDKLSRETRDYIRDLYTDGALSQREIARICGISQMQVSRIVRGEAWASEYEEWKSNYMATREEIAAM